MSERKVSRREVDSKTCITCKVTKSIDSFPTRAESIDGHRNECAACCKLRYHRIYVKNQEKNKAVAKEYRKSHKAELQAYHFNYYRENREKKRAFAKEHRLKNLEAMRQWDRKRYVRDKDKRVALSKRWQQRNREIISKKNKARYAATRDTHLVKKAIYRAQFPEKCRDCIRRWRENHREKDRENSRKWREANPEKVIMQIARKRAILANAAIGTDRDAYRKFVAKAKRASRRICYWCNRKIVGRLHIDHIIPLAKGGADSVSNLCCSCSTCNLKKNAMLPEQFTGQFEIAFPVV